MSNFQLSFERTYMAKSTTRLQVTIDLKTHAFLKVLGSKGTHGTGDKGAAKALIEQGIRRAIREEFLSKDEIAQVQTEK